MLLILFLIKLFNSTLGTSYAKADFSNIGSLNLGQNGYRKYPDGLLIQWGLAIGTSNPLTVFFLTSFLDSNYSITHSLIASPITRTVASSFLKDKTNSHFSINRICFEGMNANNTGESVLWIAIGRWK